MADIEVCACPLIFARFSPADLQSLLGTAAKPLQRLQRADVLDSLQVLLRRGRQCKFAQLTTTEGSLAHGVGDLGPMAQEEADQGTSQKRKKGEARP